MSRNGKDDAWHTDEEVTPLSVPPIAAHLAICKQLNKLSETWAAVAIETSRVQRIFRQARTPVGAEIWLDLARAFEAGRGDLDETIAMLYENALVK